MQQKPTVLDLQHLLLLLIQLPVLRVVVEAFQAPVAELAKADQPPDLHVPVGLDGEVEVPVREAARGALRPDLDRARLEAVLGLQGVGARVLGAGVDREVGRLGAVQDLDLYA